MRLKAETPESSNGDIDSVISSLDTSYPEPGDGESSADEDDAKHRRLNGMMGSAGRIISHSPSQTTYYGPYSGYAFIFKTVELFRRTPDNPLLTTETQNITATLFNAPMPEGDGGPHYSSQFQSLPSLSITLSLLDVVFTRCHPLIQFVHEADFRDMVHRLYSESALQFGASSRDFMPLFHSVLSIALLFETRLRKKHGCDDIAHEATRHFILARKELDIAQCADLISMQTILCLITFLVTTSRLTSAYTYLGIACTSALRLGLHKEIGKDMSLAGTQQEARLRIMLAVLQLDTFVSIVLDMPTRINPGCVDPAVLAALQPPSTKKLASPTETLSDPQAKYATSARHMQLLALTASGLRDIFVHGNSKEKPTNGPNIDSVDTKKMAETEDAFRKWAKALSGVPPIPQKPEMSAILKYELEMAFYLGQFILYQPFLHYLIQMANGLPIIKIQSQHALACIKIASTTITRSEIMHQRGLLAPASWSVMYTLFQAVMCLLFLIATHNGTSRPSEAWKKGELGIRLLATMRCFDNGAVRCLWIIKMVIKQLSHTVQFDVDQIVAATGCLCPCSRTALLSPESLDRRPSRDQHPDITMTTGSGGGASGYATPETPHDARAYPPSVWSRPGIEQLMIMNQDSPRHDADYILAEAQAIAMTLPIDNMDIFNFGESS